MTKQQITEVSTALAELILTACERSRSGEISEKCLAKIINNYLTQYFNGEQHQ